jgi:hypothetical protein
MRIHASVCMHVSCERESCVSCRVGYLEVAVGELCGISRIIDRCGCALRDLLSAVPVDAIVIPTQRAVIVEFDIADDAILHIDDDRVKWYDRADRTGIECARDAGAIHDLIHAHGRRDVTVTMLHRRRITIHLDLECRTEMIQRRLDVRRIRLVRCRGHDKGERTDVDEDAATHGATHRQSARFPPVPTTLNREQCELIDDRIEFHLPQPMTAAVDQTDRRRGITLHATTMVTTHGSAQRKRSNGKRDMRTHRRLTLTNLAPAVLVSQNCITGNFGSVFSLKRSKQLSSRLRPKHCKYPRGTV